MNTSFNEIINILGTPTFGNEQDIVIGYKGKDIYVFFSKDEISVYRVEKSYDFKEFEDLISRFNENKNVKTFVSGATDIWPDYDLYTYDSDYVNLQYSLKGIKIQFNITKNHGVIIYNNYIGTKENTLKNTYFKLDEDLVYEAEITRDKIVNKELENYIGD